MRFKPTIARLQSLLDLVFPPRCVYCGNLGAYLCKDCWELASPIGADICIRCGNPLTRRGVCEQCRQKPPDPIRGIRGVFFYNGPVAQGIRSLKYHGIRPLAPILAAPLIDYIREHPIPFDGLTPVPLHPQKLAERGFNQSHLLASHIASALDIPIRSDLIQRTKATRPQAQLNREERQENVKGAFSVIGNARLDGETILLIDDVATTGATLKACAQALKDLGAGDIWALTVARANINTALPLTQSGVSPADAFLLWDTERKQLIHDSSDSLI